LLRLSSAPQQADEGEELVFEVSAAVRILLYNRADVYCMSRNVDGEREGGVEIAPFRPALGAALGRGKLGKATRSD
jgi:hypothetical protein